MTKAKRLHLLIVFLCLCGMGLSQSADTLWRQANSGKRDTITVKAMLQLSEAYLARHPDSAALMARKAIALAEAERFGKWLPNAWNGLGMAAYYQSHYPEAIRAFGQYYEAARNIDDPVKMGFAKNNQGNVYIELGRYDSTILLYKEALAIRIKHKDSFGIAQSYNNLGYVYKEIGDYDKAVENMLYALRVFEKQQNRSAIGVTYNFLGQVFWKKKDLDKAIAYFTKGKAVFTDLKDQRNLAISLHSLANVMLDKNLADSAIHYYQQALAIYEETQDSRQMALISLNLGDTYQRKSDFAQAHSWYQRAIAINKAIGNQRSLPNAFIVYAASLLQAGEPAQAKLMLDSAAVFLKDSRKKTDLKDYHGSLANYFKATGQYAKALEQKELFELYKDSLLNEANSQAIADMEAKYETEQKEQEIVLQKAQLQRRNAWIIGISGFSLLLLLLGYSQYKRYQLRKEKELQAELMRQQDLATKAVMEAEENERRRIATELHDGVGQMMSAARMNLSAFEGDLRALDDQSKARFDKIVGLVDESCREVRSVSHSMMPNTLLKRGLAAAVRDFLDKIDSKVIKVNLYAEGLDNRLESSTESMLYRIIQECVNNVIKHSGANHLDISITREDSSLSLTIEDNGKGFDTQRKELFEGIGLKNILSRVQFLKGEVEFDSAPGRGTLVAIHVPVA